MPANAPYPWESPEQFQMRMLQQSAQAVPGQMAPPSATPPAAGGVMGMAAPQSQASTGQLPGQGMQDPQLGAMLDTYGDSLELDPIAQQLKQAQALRDKGMPQGRQQGRIYTAANPLEFVGAGLQQYAGNRRAKELEAEGKATRGRIGRNVKDYGKRVLAEDDEGTTRGRVDRSPKKKDEEE